MSQSSVPPTTSGPTDYVEMFDNAFRMPAMPLVRTVPSSSHAPLMSGSSVFSTTSGPSGPSASSSSYRPDTSEEEDYVAETSLPNLGVSNIRLRNYASSLDRTSTSNRSGSLLATTLIKDISISVAERARKDFPPNIAQLQWFVCLFHFNELPLKALISKLIGPTKGPGIWSTAFGKEILECQTYAVSRVFY